MTNPILCVQAIVVKVNDHLSIFLLILEHLNGNKLSLIKQRLHLSALKKKKTQMTNNKNISGRVNRAFAIETGNPGSISHQIRPKKLKVGIHRLSTLRCFAIKKSVKTSTELRGGQVAT